MRVLGGAVPIERETRNQFQLFAQKTQLETSHQQIIIYSEYSIKHHHHHHRALVLVSSIVNINIFPAAPFRQLGSLSFSSLPFLVCLGGGVSWIAYGAQSLN